jgi:cholesterol oxidase
MNDTGLDHDTDFLVIGSGFGGAVSALRLAEKGYRVVVLEQGRRWRAEDFPRTNRSIGRYLWAPGLGLRGIQALTFLRHVLVLHGTGVGGGSLVYANNLVYPPPEAFGEEAWGAAGWEERLRPHYAEARRMLGATPCPDLGETDRMLREVASALPGAGPLEVNDVGVFFGAPGVEVEDPFFGGEGPRRAGCTRCGACMVGCRVGAKNTLDRNYLWLAERGGARIVADTRAVSITDTGDGFIVETRRGARFGRKGDPWRARSVIVSGGVVGSVRLLGTSKLRGGLPALSERLGDVVRTNSEAILVADSPDASVDFGDHVAITSKLRADAETFVEMVRFNRGSDALFPLAVPLASRSRLPRPLALAVTMIRSLPWSLRALWPFGRAARSAIVLAMQPTTGHLSLRVRRGLFGQHRLRSHVPAGEAPPVGEIPVAEEITRRLAARLGGRAWQSAWTALFGSPTTAHILGGCPMGATSAEGVVDELGRVHGHPGLRVVDGSVIPANLGVNPSLTITALAEYFMAAVPPRSDDEPTA